MLHLIGRKRTGSSRQHRRSHWPGEILGGNALAGWLVEARREDKHIAQELTEHFCNTFVSPLEREDLEALASALYKIPKTTEKFGERLMLAPQHVRGLRLKRKLVLLEKADGTLVPMVKELRKGVDLETVKAQNDQPQQIEGEADKLMLESLRELYTGDRNVVQLVIQKDLSSCWKKSSTVVATRGTSSSR